MSMTTAIPALRSTRQAATGTSIWRVGLVATAVGAIATEAFGLAARAVDIPMRAADPGSHGAKQIPVGGLAMAVVMWAALGTVFAVGLARWARRPARTFALTTVTVTVLSLAGPVFAADTTTATKVVLTVAHIVAAAVVIPPLTARLADARD